MPIVLRTTEKFPFSPPVISINTPASLARFNIHISMVSYKPRIHTVLWWNLQGIHRKLSHYLSTKHALRTDYLCERTHYHLWLRSKTFSHLIELSAALYVYSIMPSQSQQVSWASTLNWFSKHGTKMNNTFRAIPYQKWLLCRFQKPFDQVSEITSLFFTQYVFYYFLLTQPCEPLARWFSSR